MFQTSYLIGRVLCIVLLAYPLSSLYLAKVPILIIPCALLLIFILSFFEIKNNIVPLLNAGKWLVVFSTISLVTIREFDVAKIVAVMMPLAMYFLVCKAYSSNESQRVSQFKLYLLTVWVAIFLISVFLLLKFGTLRALNSTQKEVIGAFTNSLTGPALIALLFSAFFYKYSKNILYILIGLLSTIILVLTQSRAAMVLWFLSSLYIISLYVRSGSGFVGGVSMLKHGALFIAIGVVMVLMFHDSISSVINRFGSVLSISNLLSNEFNPGVKTEDYSRKLQLYLSFEILQKNPWFGVGFDEFKTISQERFGVSITIHNIFIRSWVASGIVAPLVLLLLFSSVFSGLNQRRMSYRLDKNRFAEEFYLTLMFSLVVLFIQGQFRGMFGDYFFMFMISSLVLFSSKTAARN